MRLHQDSAARSGPRAVPPAPRSAQGIDDPDARALLRRASRARGSPIVPRGDGLRPDRRLGRRTSRQRSSRSA